MYAVMVVLAQSLAFGLLPMALVLATREQFLAIFTGDRHLQKAVSSIAYMLAVTMVLNSVQPVISGVAVAENASVQANLSLLVSFFGGLAPTAAWIRGMSLRVRGGGRRQKEKLCVGPTR
jgi:Na+-driven multidrug efflux pump